MKNQIKSAEFFLGGRAIFTVHNNVGEQYTYKIVKSKKSGLYFVSLLSGPNNETDYTYMGLLMPDLMQARTTEKSLLNLSAPAFRVLNWALKTVSQGKQIPFGYGIRHEGKCCVCALRLTDAESIETGIGPVCAKKMKGKKAA